ncbi:MAG TPA: PD-(D/E)XK nuclease family protein [Phycisphaerae bacterium]|nr:PD-(D/E)XK nuclease family protein [Phycisphaerae bacterium]
MNGSKTAGWFDEPTETDDIRWFRRSRVEALVYGCPAKAQVEQKSLAMAFGSLGHSLLRDYMAHLQANVLGSDMEYLIEEARKCTDDPRLQPAMLSLMRRCGRRIYLPEGRVVGIELGLGHEVMAGVGIQGELDRLDNCLRPDELEINDYKFGYGSMGFHEARQSLQGRTYSYLVLANYPDCFRVWFTFHFLRVDDPLAKDGYRQVRFDYTRDDFDDLAGHMTGALMKAVEIEDSGEFGYVPGWPQCADCPIVSGCPKAEPYAPGAIDVVALAGQAVALGEKLAAMKKSLKAHVEASGPVFLPGGGAWLVSTSKKATFGFSKKATEDEAEEPEEGSGP